MVKRKIIIEPDPILRIKSENLDKVDNALRKLMDDMLETMYKSNGIGLAAPQVGILSRLIVMDCTEKDRKKKPLKFVNPEILETSSEKSEFEEGCLSLPAQFAKVERPNVVLVKYKDENIWGLTARLLVTLSAGFNLREYPPCNDI